MPVQIEKNILLIDFPNLAIRNLMASGQKTKFDLWRHMTLKSIIGLIQKFQPVEIIICLDGKYVWRKDVYPQYKANRKKLRKKSDIYWSGYYEVYEDTICEYKTMLPFKIFIDDKMEADDIIAMFCLIFKGQQAHPISRKITKRPERVIVISSDKDFHQLMLYGIDIYDAMTKRMRRWYDYPVEKLRKDLFVKICTADGPRPGVRGDGIANLFRGCGKKKALQLYKEFGPTAIPTEYLTAYKRNEMLMDLKWYWQASNRKLFWKYINYKVLYNSNEFQQYLKYYNLNQILKKIKIYNNLFRRLISGG